MTEHYIDRPGGRQLRVLEQGSRNGQVVMYLHGVPGAADEAWLPDEFTERVRLLAFDRPGYGGSSPCPDYDLETMADDVLAIADALSVQKMTLLGFSAGGLFALACAGLMKDRVTRVVSVGAPALHWLNDPDQEAAPLTANAWQGARTDPALLAESLTALTTDVSTLQTALRDSLSVEDIDILDQPEGQRRFECAMRRTIEQGAAVSAATLARDLYLMVSPWPYDLEGLSASLCFIHGDRDQLLTLRHLEAFQKYCPQSDVVVLPGEGHYSPLQGSGASDLWSRWVLKNTNE